MKIYKITTLIIIFFLSACGYKIANNIEDYKFSVSKYNLKGEKKINNILDRNFKRFVKNENSIKVFEIESTSKFDTSIMSKDSTGKAASYKMEITIDLNISSNNDLLKRISFNEKTNYDNTDSKFELKQYEDIILQDLVDKIVFQINNYLSTIK